MLFACEIVTRIESRNRALRIAESSRRRSDYTDACYRQGAQGTDWEHPQAGSCQSAKDDGGKAGVRFLARSKRGTKSMTA
jgi:hypothetical protein